MTRSFFAPAITIVDINDEHSMRKSTLSISKANSRTSYSNNCYKKFWKNLITLHPLSLSLLCIKPSFNKDKKQIERDFSFIQPTDYGNHLSMSSRTNHSSIYRKLFFFPPGYAKTPIPFPPASMPRKTNQISWSKTSFPRAFFFHLINNRSHG